MNNILLKYLILPKGVKSIFFKSYVYFIPFLYALKFSSNYFHSVVLFFSVFFLFEFVINPARYQLNDSIDYEGDQKRKFNWVRPVNKANVKIVLRICFLRFILGTSLVFLIDFRLAILAIVLFLLQIIYDFFAKKNSAFMAIFVVSVAYPIRSLAVFFCLNIQMTSTVYLILLCIFMYSTYMIIQWRKNESFFILSNNLEQKYNSSVFSKKSVDLFLNIILGVFLCCFYFLIIDLLKVQETEIMFVSIISFLITVFLIFNIRMVISQPHNILALFIFLLLLDSNVISSISIITIVALSIIWYHKLYVVEFAKIYFKEKKYEKK